jgi:hypothetical protein
MQHELRLLLSFLVDTQDRPLALRHGDFRGSSGHVKRFISESFGLGMLTAAKGQWKRLGDIVAWFGENDIHPVTMTYAYTGAANAQVDLFGIAAPGYPGMAPGIVIADEAGLATTRTERRFERLAFIRPQAIGRVTEIADQLYETPRTRFAGCGAVGLRAERAGELGDCRSDRPVHATVLPRPARPAAHPTADRSTPPSAQRHRATRRRRGPVAATGRILVAEARDATQDPSWSEATARME